MEESIHSLTDAPGGRVQPIGLIARLMKQTANMQHIDDVFLWLAHAMVQSLDITVVQFLAIQRDSVGQFYVEVRAAASKLPSLSRVGDVNNQVTTLAKRVFHEQQGITSRPVESLFPPSQAALLTPHNLHCWAGYFLHNDAFLSPARTEHAPGKIPRPLPMIVSLFTPSPLSTEQARAIHFTLEQAVRIIINRGLLTLRAAPEPTITRNPPKDVLLAHGQMVPRRAENIEQFQAANPFASASIILDKNARRLYAAIDGNKNLAELAQMTGLGREEMLDALHYLFEQQKIHFYTLLGELIQKPNFISSLP